MKGDLNDSRDHKNLEHSENAGKQDMARQKDVAQHLLQQFMWAGHAEGQGDPPQLLRRAHKVVFTYPMRTDTTVISIKPKAIASITATQTKLLRSMHLFMQGVFELGISIRGQKRLHLCAVGAGG